MPAILIPLAVSAIATAAGAAAQAIFAPRRKQVPVDKGKYDDIRVTGSDYGAFIPRGWGIFRIGGNIVYSNGIQTHTVTTHGGGGKKQPTGSEINYTYTTSLGILVCRGEISSVRRIWADTKVIYGGGIINTVSIEAESGTLANGAYTVTDDTASGDAYVTGLASGTLTISLLSASAADVPIDPGEPTIPVTAISFYYKTASLVTADVRLTDENGNTDRTVTFHTSNSWTAQSIEFTGEEFADYVSSVLISNAGGLQLDKITVRRFRRRGSSLTPVSGAINPDIDYPPDLDDPGEYYNYSPVAVAGQVDVALLPEQIRFYLGTETQEQDASEVTWLDDRYGIGEGVLRDPAYRGLARVVMQDHIIPNGQLENFTFEIENTNDTLGDVLADLFADVGITSYDVSDVAAYSAYGILESSASSRKSFIETLERFFFFRLAEIDGNIVAIPDSGTSVVTIDADDLRAHLDSEAMPASDAAVELKEESQMPREVRVSCMNPDIDFHNESVPAQLFSTQGTESKEFTFPIVERPAITKGVAEKLILKEYSEDRNIVVSAMPSYAKCTPGDTITIPVNGQDQLVRIEKKRITKLPVGPVVFETVKTGYTYTDVVFDDTTTTTLGRALEQLPTKSFPRNTIVFVIQSPAIRTGDEGKLGVYLAPCGRGRGVGKRAALYRETDEDNFVPQFNIDTFSPVGLCASALVNATGTDNTNTLDINFFDDVSLETVTDADLARSPLTNLIRVGNEWLQFKTAAPLEPDSPHLSKWRISNLTRGLYDTSTAHTTDEYAAVYTPNLKFFELDEWDIGETVTLKAVTAGQDVSVAPAEIFTFAGNENTRAFRLLGEYYTSSTTSGTGTEYPYSTVIKANTLANDGDMIVAEYSGSMITPGNRKWLFVNINLTLPDVFDSSAYDDLTLADGVSWKISTTIIRESLTSLRTVTTLTVPGYDPFIAHTSGAVAVSCDAEITLQLGMNSRDAAGDITAQTGYVEFRPAHAPSFNANLLFLGSPLTFNGEQLTFLPFADTEFDNPGNLTFDGELITFLGETLTFNP